MRGLLFRSMPNHVHLLILEKTTAIGEIVKRITVSYDRSENEVNPESWTQLKGSNET